MNQMNITVNCPTHHASLNGSHITMSSREIASLVDSRHSNVCVTIERLMSSGVIGGYAAMQYTHPQNGQTYHYYQVNKRDSYVIVAQLCPEFTARLVDRWQELEQGNQLKVPQSFSEALRLAAELEEQKQRLSDELSIAAPKAEFVDRYVTATGSMSFRQVAKLLQIKENTFRSFLVENKIMYLLNGEWTAYQNHVDAKRFHVKTGVSEFGHAFNHALFTPKGIEWIAAELAKSNVREVMA